MHDLGTLGGNYSRANGINDDGWVVGLADDVAGIPRPFLYDGTSMRDLNEFIDPNLGWTLSLPRDINNAGQIVVRASHASEPWAHALLLTPIPEPAAAALLGLAIPLLQSRRPKGRYSNAVR
ncbi:hypothetical protein BH09PLA1_BH09PLA1_35880 [soil metagenome]